MGSLSDHGFLLSMCSEVLHTTFNGVEPEDLASLSKSCRMLHHFIENDQLLWREQYLSKFDPPFRKWDVVEKDASQRWQARLKDLVVMEKVLASDSSDIKRDHLAFVATHAIDLLSTPPADPRTSLNATFLAEQFETQANIDTLLCASSLFKSAEALGRIPADSEPDRQLSAQLHVLYGVSVESLKGGARPIHPYARARVYDLRRYIEDANFWGPFLDDGSQDVDWEKLESIMMVLDYNLRLFSERVSRHFGPVWSEPFAGLAEDSGPSLRLTKQPSWPLEEQDPYGITGTWIRVVCFLNYDDLYSMNFESDPIPLDQERDPIYTQEALRLITIKLRVTRIEPPGYEDGQTLPVVHFSGVSRVMYMPWDPNANSRIRGTVRTTPSGAVRWTTFSIYQGEERWRSEGIQIGGLRSARGVLGTWFHKNYDLHGPAGPTAFWKLNNETGEDGPQPTIIV